MIDKITMATNPSEIQKIEADVAKVYTFGKSHAILAVALIVSLFVGVYLFDSKRADKADARAALSAEQAKEKDALNIQLQAQNQQLQISLANSEAQQKETAQALIAAAQALQAAAKQKVAAVPTLTAPALAVQWGQEAQEPAPAIDSQGIFQVPLPLAQKSLVALIEVPALTQANQKLQDANTSLTGAVQDADKQLSSEKTAHSSDATTCVVDKKALNDQISALKKTNARRNLKYMIFGGAIIEAVRIYLGRP
jgi:hypothetical protein